VSIDGSLIEAVLSMHWADYRDNLKKTKVYVGFDINRAIPSKIFLTDGEEGERPFVGMILSPVLNVNYFSRSATIRIPVFRFCPTPI
jgi:hypothetical protein